jgi:hypothetical protein
VTTIVPKTDDRIVAAVMVTDDAQGSRAQYKILACRGFQSEPASGEDLEPMAVGKEQHITVDGAEPVDDSVHPDSHIRGRFTIRTTVAE